MTADGARHLHHLTITTGDTRRSYLDEVSVEALTAAREMLDEALAHGRAEIPGVAPGHWLRATPYGRCLLVTVMYGDSLPLVTFGVASRARCGAVLWRGLLDGAVLAPGVRPDPERQPQAPWCAVRIEPGLPLMPDSAAWLGDMERCIAWAWVAGA